MSAEPTPVERLIEAAAPREPRALGEPRWRASTPQG